jgi:hypothetical protein
MLNEVGRPGGMLQINMKLAAGDLRQQLLREIHQTSKDFSYRKSIDKVNI